MKYYKINIERRFPEQDRVLGHANGEFVPNGKHYFDKIGNGEIIKDAPVFDYFHLQSFGPKEEWEWRLQDVHGFIGAGSIITGWYISDKCKKVFEKFSIIKDCHFYAPKLLYKEEKFDYWIFQFSVNYFQNINYQQSEFYIEGESERITHIKNGEEYVTFDLELYKTSKKSIVWKNIVYTEAFDFIENLESEFFVSEQLKEAIKEAGLQGFLFSEKEYEIIRS
jgi:hypothetical protein